MIEMRRAQRSFGDGLIAEEVGDLREDWMAHADAVLVDEELVAAVYQALGPPRNASRGTTKSSCTENLLSNSSTWVIARWRATSW
jgi:hypothetical protein